MSWPGSFRISVSHPLHALILLLHITCSAVLFVQVNTVIEGGVGEAVYTRSVKDGRDIYQMPS